MRNLKLIFSISLIVFCLIFSILAYSQQIATTQDGKKVLLKVDGTWEYIKDSPQKGYKTFKMGAVIRVSDFQFCLNSARWSKVSDLDSPKSGYIWLILNCTVKNISDEPIIMSSMLSLKLVDKEGYSQDQAIFADIKGSLDGQLSPNQTMKGEIAYEVEIKQSYWEFIFEPELFGLSQIIYSIEKDQVK